MKKCLIVAAGLTMSVVLAGCIVAPPRVIGPRVIAPAVPVGVVVPPGVVYVEPSYAVPGPGYVWSHHPRYGWGYRHPRSGWHRGWY